MKKVILISVLSIYAFSVTEFHQWIKIPFLAEHYYEHKEHNSDLTLWQFLLIHYGKKDSAAKDHEEDRKLPFKANHFMFTSAVDVTLPSSFPHLVFNKSIPKDKIFSTYYLKRVGSSYLAAIWQPPKAC